MSEYKPYCPVCCRNAYINNASGYFGVYISCPDCGKFFLESELYKEENGIIKMPTKRRSCFYYYLTQKKPRNIKAIPHFHSNANWGDNITVEQNNHQIISLKSIMNLFPTNIEEQIKMICVNLAHKCKYIGAQLMLSPRLLPEQYHLFFIDDSFDDTDCKEQQMDYLLKILKASNIIDQIKTNLDAPPTYVLTANGWMVVQQYLSTEATSKQAFVAMWFDISMKSAREQIIRAINDCGYSEMIIDTKEHNNQIVPEIFYEIKHSSFIIADLTGQRGGVYYEAGYAEASDIPVILCCRKTSDEKTHFDVQQKNTIFWEDEADLYNRLMKRITATVGKRLTL